MKKYNLLFLCILLANCTSSAQKVELEFNFPHCGESTLNSMKISKICATRDFIATPLKKQKKDWLSFLAAEGSSGYKGHNEIGGGIQEFKNQELDMKNHVWDFTNQDSPSVILRGYNSTVTGGTILKASLNFGSNDYFAPNFRTKKQINNSDVEKHGFYYAKFESNAVEPDNSMENLSLEKMSLDLNGLSFNSWGGGIKNSKIILDKKLFVSGSKAFILNNQLISRVKIYEKNKKFTLNFNQ